MIRVERKTVRLERGDFICSKAGLDCFVIFGKKVVRTLVIEFYRCKNQKMVVVVNVISMVVELNTTGFTRFTAPDGESRPR